MRTLPIPDGFDHITSFEDQRTRPGDGLVLIRTDGATVVIDDPDDAPPVPPFGSDDAQTAESDPD